MDLILEGLLKAFHLIVSLDAEVLGITWLSLKVSGSATLISVVIGISCGMLVALNRFPGKKLLVSVVNTGMGLPPWWLASLLQCFSGGMVRLDSLTSSILPRQ